MPEGGYEDDDGRPTPAPMQRRCLAGLLDFAVISVVFVLFVYSVAGGESSSSGEVVLSTLWFLMLHAYYFLPELFWDGRTLGKWAFELKVVDVYGQQPDPFRILIRTLLRMVDFVPGLYLTGLLVCWVTGPRRRQRLGDLAGGTMVVTAPRQ